MNHANSKQSNFLVNARCYVMLAIGLVGLGVAVIHAVMENGKRNLDYLALVRELRISDWGRYVTTEECRQNENSGASIVMRILNTSGNVQGHEQMLFDVTESLPSLFAHLNFARGRNSLGDIFVALDQVCLGWDDSAIAELLAQRASGLLFSISQAFYDAKSKRASLYLQAAAQLDSRNYPILRQQAIVYLANKEYCSLLQVAQIGVELYPSGGLFHYYLGRAYEGLGVWRQASKAYQQALERFPDYEPYEKRLNYSLEKARTSPTSGSNEVCK